MYCCRKPVSKARQHTEHQAERGGGGASGAGGRYYEGSDGGNVLPDELYHRGVETIHKEKGHHFSLLIDGSHLCFANSDQVYIDVWVIV